MPPASSMHGISAATSQGCMIVSIATCRLGPHDPDWAYARASGAGRRRLGVPVASPGPSSPPPAPGNAPHSAPRAPRESPGTARHTVASADGHRPACPSGRRRPGPGMAGLSVGHGQARGGETSGRKPAAGGSPSSPGFSRPSAETQPRCGGTLGGVQRPQGMRVPRMRQAPDGGQEGGSQPTESSVLHRRVFLAPALPMDEVKQEENHVKKSVAHS